MSEDFKELLSSSNLNEKSREAVRIICKGGIPTPIQVARPGLIDIIKFFIETYQCTKDEFSDATSDLEEKPFSCSQCDERFQSEDDLEDHSCPKKNPQKELEESIFGPDNQNSDKQEEKKEVSKFKCQKCYKWLQLDDIENHVCEKKQKPQFACSQRKCNKRFATEVALREHEKIHNDEKPFSCSKCDKTFASEEEQKTHSKMHLKHCPYHRKNICKFGRSGKTNEGSCPFLHRNKCTSFMKDNKGKCKYGDSCRFMHPVKCKNIREKGKCDDNDCKLFHFKKPRAPKLDARNGTLLNIQGLLRFKFHLE